MASLQHVYMSFLRRQESSNQQTQMLLVFKTSIFKITSLFPDSRFHGNDM
ncbi:hypothetical protein [Rickettsia endosymbiont of Cantharis rufa]